MAARKTEAAETAVEIPRIDRRTTDFYIVGDRPLICNRMSEKSKQDILNPPGRKTAVQKATTLKHDPISEFQASPYIFTDEDSETLLAMMSSAFKGAMATAALDLPGAKKAQIGRLVWVNNDYTGIFGPPRLFMSVVRSADMNKTPDIRTRAIVFPWAAKITVSFVMPMITPTAVSNLLYAAGLTVGVGDWRPEKGKGTYGQFSMVESADDPRFVAAVQAGRDLQKARLFADDPECYDEDSQSLLDWWRSETKRRGQPVARPQTRLVYTESRDGKYLEGVTTADGRAVAGA